MWNLSLNWFPSLRQQLLWQSNNGGRYELGLWEVSNVGYVGCEMSARFSNLHWSQSVRCKSYNRLVSLWSACTIFFESWLNEAFQKSWWSQFPVFFVLNFKPARCSPKSYCIAKMLGIRQEVSVVSLKSTVVQRELRDSKSVYNSSRAKPRRKSYPTYWAHPPLNDVCCPFVSGNLPAVRGFLLHSCNISWVMSGCGEG